MSARLLLILLAAAASGAAAAPFTPHAALDFGRSPDAIAADCRDARSRAESKLAQIGALPPGARTFDSTFAALDRAYYELWEDASVDVFLKHVSTASAVRDASAACDVLLKKFDVELFTREDLYRTLREFAATAPRLEGEDARLVRKTMLDFKRAGMELSPEKRAELKSLRERLAQLGTDFDKNIADAQPYKLFTRAQLAGLSEDYVSRLKQEDGKYRVGTPYPEYQPFMQRARDGAARRELSILFSDRAVLKNKSILKEMLELRLKAAKLLGYPSHAHYVIETRMAKDPETVRKFLDRVSSRLEAGAQEELEVLKSFKRGMEGKEGAKSFNSWDWPFYDDLVKRVKYEVDSEALREYFPADAVIDQVLQLYQRSLGLKFRRVPAPATWHPDVPLFEVTDSASNELIGHFYLDLYPRDGKYSHAMETTLIKGRRLPDGTYRKPVAAMVANFTKPTAEKPSLLSHRELETLLHEFGHVMHDVLGRSKHGRFAGTNVAWDFVEAPSQTFENWAWEPEVLRSLSGHYKDRNRKLPPELIEKLAASKLANTALAHSRQVSFAAADQAYHKASVPSDTSRVWADAMLKHFLIPMTPGTSPETSFGHLEGYDAAYYSYLWAEVYAEDMFSRFKAEGVTSPVVGRDYRRHVLEAGSSRDEMDSIRAFLGREPNEDAFLKALGL